MLSTSIIDFNDQKVLFSIYNDITEKKKLEISLIAAKEKAEEHNRLKTAFLQNVSHEIRTPMNGILGFMNLLNEPGLDDKVRSNFIKIINKSGERLMNTINDIVEISRIESGDVILKYDTIDLVDLMKYHYDFFKIQTEEKGLNFEITEQISLVAAKIKTDKHKLDGIITNLIKNAIKFTEKGKIEFGNYLDKDKLWFYISDSGKGIPQDKQEVIFDRFVQADSSLSRGYEGSGIGLSIVKAYVESLGGEIIVKSEVGKGSTFLFSVPYEPVLAEINVSEINSVVLNLHDKPTILIAEDDDVNYYLLENILARNYILLHALNGEETLEIFNNNPNIHLILMDIKMPGKYNGFEATRKIREINQQIPIIAQTAYASMSDKLISKEVGCNDFITKPFTSKNLLTLIQKYLKKND